jgi:hypothetical protein
MNILALFGLLATGISDPQGILAKVDAFLGQPDFTSAFHSRDAWTYHQKSCIGQGGSGPCDEMDSRMDVEIGSDAKLTTSVGDHATNVQSITRENWCEWLGNTVRIEIAGLNSSGFAVSVDQIETSTATVEVNGQTQVLESRKISLTGNNSGSITSREVLEVVNGLPGIAQLVFLKKTSASFFGGGVDTLSLTTFHREK